MAATAALAQQGTGTLGSPGASTTINGKQLPPPDPKLGGVITEDALQSRRAALGRANNLAADELAA
jgi:hypothetical protein